MNAKPTEAPATNGAPAWLVFIDALLDLLTHSSAPYRIELTLREPQERYALTVPIVPAQDHVGYFPNMWADLPDGTMVELTVRPCHKLLGWFEYFIRLGSDLWAAYIRGLPRVYKVSIRLFQNDVELIQHACPIRDGAPYAWEELSGPDTKDGVNLLSYWIRVAVTDWYHYEAFLPRPAGKAKRSLAPRLPRPPVDRNSGLSSVPEWAILFNAVLQGVRTTLTPCILKADYKVDTGKRHRPITRIGSLRMPPIPGDWLDDVDKSCGTIDISIVPYHADRDLLNWLSAIFTALMFRAIGYPRCFRVRIVRDLTGAVTNVVVQDQFVTGRRHNGEFAVADRIASSEVLTAQVRDGLTDWFTRSE